MLLKPEGQYTLWGSRRVRHLLGVAVARNGARLDALKETSQLPRRGTTLRVSAQALLSHDRDGVALRTTNVREYIVPDRGLVLLL